MDTSRRSTAEGEVRITIADVARHCGLSIAAVSQALNPNSPQRTLRSQTRERIVTAARELGFRPSWRAKALANRSTQTIGLISGRIVPFMSGVNETLTETLAHHLGQRGFHLLLIPWIDHAEPVQQILSADRLDGCVVTAPLPADISTVIDRSPVPLVLLNLRSALPVAQIVPDDAHGARLVTRHVIELGHRRIAFLMYKPEAHFSVTERQRGVLETARKAGLGSGVTVYSDVPYDRFVSDVVAAPGGPTAVICYDHAVAAELTYALWRAGLRVPRDVSVAAFNDVYALERMTPPVTTVALPAEAMAKQAVELLLERIAGKSGGEAAGGEVSGGRASPPPPSAQVITFPERLIMRESTAAPPKR
jgi:LacI family transcriptional regulator